jgi:hypothetical protein
MVLVQARQTAPRPVGRIATLAPTLSTSLNGDGVFPLFLWRRRSILYLPRRNIDDELGELGGIAGTLFHFKSKSTSTRKQRQNWR